jgi:hypothetical protein
MKILFFCLSASILIFGCNTGNPNDSSEVQVSREVDRDASLGNHAAKLGDISEVKCEKVEASSVPEPVDETYSEEPMGDHRTSVSSEGHDYECTGGEGSRTTSFILKAPSDRGQLVSFWRWDALVNGEMVGCGVSASWEGAKDAQRDSWARPGGYFDGGKCTGNIREVWKF